MIINGLIRTKRITNNMNSTSTVSNIDQLLSLKYDSYDTQDSKPYVSSKISITASILRNLNRNNLLTSKTIGYNVSSSHTLRNSNETITKTIIQDDTSCLDSDTAKKAVVFKSTVDTASNSSGKIGTMITHYGAPCLTSTDNRIKCIFNTTSSKLFIC